MGFDRRNFVKYLSAAFAAPAVASALPSASTSAQSHKSAGGRRRGSPKVIFMSMFFRPRKVQRRIPPVS